jgi:hypothetical protein
LDPKGEEATKELSPKRGMGFFGSRPAGMPSMSFLDQIKNGMKKSSSSETKKSSDDVSKPSFLDQIKNGIKSSSKSEKPSFLDQIKGFKTKTIEVVDNTEESQANKENSDSNKETKG